MDVTQTYIIYFPGNDETEQGYKLVSNSSSTLAEHWSCWLVFSSFKSFLFSKSFWNGEASSFCLCIREDIIIIHTGFVGFTPALATLSVLYLNDNIASNYMLLVPTFKLT